MANPFKPHSRNTPGTRLPPADTLKTVQALEWLEAAAKEVRNVKLVAREVATIRAALIAQMQRDAVQPCALCEGSGMVHGRGASPYVSDPCNKCNGFGTADVDALARAAAPHPEAQALDSQLQQPDDVGGLEYRGNSVSFIHSKMAAYRSAIDEAWTALRECGCPPDGKTRLADAIRALVQQDQLQQPDGHSTRSSGVCASTGGVDWLGLALDLEAQARRVESQTAERAMLAAAHGLRLMGVRG